MAKSRRSACSMGSRGAAVAEVETCLEGIRRKALDMCVLLALRTECCAEIRRKALDICVACRTKPSVAQRLKMWVR